MACDAEEASWGSRKGACRGVVEPERKTGAETVREEPKPLGRGEKLPGRRGPIHALVVT